MWAATEIEYDRLLGLAPADRAGRLEAIRAKDPALAALLVRMLEAGDSTSFLNLRTRTIDAPHAEHEVPKFSNYRVTGLIGEGGMARVYRATQLRPPREVALKVLRPGKGTYDEAAVLAGLKHQGIVTVFEVGAENGQQFFSMELVDGMDLAKCLECSRAAAHGGSPAEINCPLPPFRSRGSVRAIAEIAGEITDALAAAHKMGIWHRDIKPSNILLDRDRKVKIVDFGIAGSHAADERRGERDLFGAPPYMSPERLHSKLTKLDHRADIYSVGIVMYELLTTQHPFGGGTHMDVLKRILNGVKPTSIQRINPLVPTDLQTIVEKAMDPDPDDRYQTAVEMRDDLLRFLAYESIIGRPQSAVSRCRKWTYRHRRTLLAGALVIAAAATASMWTLHARRERELDAVRERASRELLSGPLGLRPLADRCALAGFVAQYDEDRLGRSPAELDRLRQALETYRLDQLARIAADTDRWRKSDMADRDREAVRLALLERLVDLRAVFPSDPAVQQATVLENLMPRLTVRAVDIGGHAIRAAVRLMGINVVTMARDAEIRLGDAPVLDATVMPGYYRLVVDFAEGGQRELPLYIGAGSSQIAISAVRKDDEPALGQGMVTIAACDLRMPSVYSEMPFGNQTVHVEAFQMDPTEVTNKQYLEFVRATSHRRPALWPPEYDPAYDDFPVVGVTGEDAAAYAAWAGKRLPTLPEWLVAAGIAAGRPWPWGGKPEDPMLGNVGGSMDLGMKGPRDLWNCYIKNASPVRSHPEAASPEGVYHLCGNVTEWTETMAVNFIDSADGKRSIAVSPWARLCAGPAWNAAITQRTAIFLREFGISSTHVSHEIGFRCVKSLTVLTPAKDQ